MDIHFSNTTLDGDRELNERIREIDARHGGLRKATITLNNNTPFTVILSEVVVENGNLTQEGPITIPPRTASVHSGSWTVQGGPDTNGISGSIIFSIADSDTHKIDGEMKFSLNWVFPASCEKSLDFTANKRWIVGSASRNWHDFSIPNIDDCRRDWYDDHQVWELIYSPGKF